jgi:hypothetical protein
MMGTPLQSLKDHGIQSPEWEKDRVEILEKRGKEGKDVVRRSNENLTLEEREEREETEEREEREERGRRNARLGIVGGKDLKDDEIMGVE